MAKIGTGPAALTKIKGYLRSVGIDPRTVVIQTGKHNYAGARCPGKRWACTTATRVFQAGSDNVFQCTASSGTISQSNAGGTQTCTISQTGGGSNTATCTEHTNSPTAVQSCQITQVGRSNLATVNQQNGSNGTTQSASQTATVNQSGALSSNTARITQTIAQDASGAAALMQDGWARLDLVQSSMQTGRNIANVTQRVTQNANGGTSHKQDTLAGSTGDCDPASGPLNPNLCANISQTGLANGDNQTDLFQKIIESSKTGAVANQRQGSGSGGMDGKVHQSTGSLGTNWNQVNQNKIQTAIGASGSTQVQFDPVYCCGVGSQAGGNANNQESLGQGVAQSASEDNASQDSDLIGESLNPNGHCDITQGAANNAASANNTAAATPCPFLHLETSCSNGGESEGGCTSFDPVTTPPGSPDLSVDKAVRDVPIEGPAPDFSRSTLASWGDTLQYRLIYSNDGSGTAHNVSITDTLPEFLTYVSGSCTNGCTYNPDTRTITWTVGDVESDGGNTFFFNAIMGQTCAPVVNTAVGHDNEEGPKTSNTATATALC